jgi:REP element-mobilizing transposase RayT
MPRNRKCFIHGTVVEIGFRIQEGLLLPPTKLMRALLDGLLARAQNLYPLTICHFVIMSNHVHLLGVVQDPNDVPRFMEYFKRESAHAINRMLSRPQRTVWSPGYDSPTVLDAQKTIQRIIYFYTNPQQARLVQRIEDYPHLSSWEAFLADGSTHEVPYFPRTAVPKSLSPGDGNSLPLLMEMQRKAKVKHTLRILPHAWMNCFNETIGCDALKYKNEILSAVRQKESELDRTCGESVVGKRALQSSELRLDFTPKKCGKRMICLGSTKEIRRIFIEWFKISAIHAAKAISGWIRGSANQITPGFFAPGGLLHSYLVPVFTPLPLG